MDAKHDAAQASTGAAAPSHAAETFQQRVDPWLIACLGEQIARDSVERNHRFLEEALELVQAGGCTASEAHQLVDYVFGRPVGEMVQEIGGVMVTLAALCLARGVDMHAAGETELARIWTKIEAIRAKQAAKPKHSPLLAAPAAPQGVEAEVPEPSNTKCKFAAGGANCVDHCGDPVCLDRLPTLNESLARLRASIEWLRDGKSHARGIGVADMVVLEAALATASTAPAAADGWCLNGHHERLDGCPYCAAATQAPSEPLAVPEFWYRPRLDGGYEGPIHNGRIEEVRKRSGAWLPLYSGAIPQQAPSSEARDAAVSLAWQEAVAEAYGYLWHVNNEPAAPIPLYSPEKAAYEARKRLRDLLTHEQRGDAINRAGAALAREQAGSDDHG